MKARTMALAFLGVITACLTAQAGPGPVPVPEFGGTAILLGLGVSAMIGFGWRYWRLPPD